MPEQHDRLIGGSRLLHSRLRVHNSLLIVAPSDFDRLMSGYRGLLL